MQQATNANRPAARKLGPFLSACKPQISGFVPHTLFAIAKKEWWGLGPQVSNQHIQLSLRTSQRPFRAIPLFSNEVPLARSLPSPPSFAGTDRRVHGDQVRLQLLLFCLEWHVWARSWDMPILLAQVDLAKVICRIAAVFLTI